MNPPQLRGDDAVMQYNHHLWDMLTKWIEEPRRGEAERFFSRALQMVNGDIPETAADNAVLALCDRADYLMELAYEAGYKEAISCAWELRREARSPGADAAGRASAPCTADLRLSAPRRRSNRAP